MTMFCSKCRKEQNFENWYIDDNVYHKNCTNCGLNLSINKKEAKSALIANGTKVKLKKDKLYINNIKYTYNEIKS